MGGDHMPNICVFNSTFWQCLWSSCTRRAVLHCTEGTDRRGCKAIARNTRLSYREQARCDGQSANAQQMRRVSFDKRRTYCFIGIIMIDEPV